MVDSHSAHASPPILMLAAIMNPKPTRIPRSIIKAPGSLAFGPYLV